MSTETQFIASKRSSRPMVSQVVVQSTAPRSVRSSMGPGMSFSSKTNIRQSGVFNPLPAGELVQKGKNTMQALTDTRSNEKRDLSQLNTKLAEHLEKTKFMEGMNKQLKMQLDKLKALKCFDETKIKELITDELDEMRNAIKGLNERCAALQAENLKLKDKVDTTREDIQILRSQRDALNEDKEKLCRINADLEGDINKLRKEIEFADNKRRMALEELAGTKDDVERLQDDLCAAQEEQMNLADKLNALQEGYEFELECKEKECEELRNLVRQLQNMEPDYSKMWEGQFKESLMKLQAENDERINRHLADVQRQYEMKIQRMQAQVKHDQPDGGIHKAETKTLKSELGNVNSKLSSLQNENDILRRQLEKMQDDFRKQCEECEHDKNLLRQQLETEKADKAEIQELLEKLELEKGTLDGEIGAYRCLLDQVGFGDALAADGNFMSRGGAMMSDAIMGGSAGSSGGRGGSSSQSSNPKSTEPGKKQPADKPKRKPDPVTSESTGRRVMKKMFSGDLIIEECADDGSYVSIKNKGSSEKDLSACCIKRGSNRGDAKFQFKKGQKIKPFQVLKVFSERFEDDAGSNDIVAKNGQCKTWGSGSGACEIEDEDPVTHKTKCVAKLELQYQ